MLYFAIVRVSRVTKPSADTTYSSWMRTFMRKSLKEKT